MNKRFFVISLAGLLLFGVASDSRATVTYSYLTDTTTYNAASGSASVTVSLKETLSGSSSIINSDGGVAGAGFQFKLLSGSGLTISNFAPAAAFTGLASSNAKSGVFSFNVNTASGGVVIGDTDLMPLATITFTTSGGATTSGYQLAREAAQEGTNTLTATHGFNLDDNSTTPSFTGVDQTVENFTISVPTPEPGSILFCASAAIWLFRQKRLAPHHRRGEAL